MTPSNARNKNGSSLPWGGLALLAAALYAISNIAGIPWLGWITKPLPVLCLLGLLPVWSPRRDLYRDLLMAGFVLSAIGDLFMIKDHMFILGLSSFLLAHICYIAAFSSSAPARIPLHPVRIVPFLAFGALMLWFLWPSLGEMKIPVLMYVAVILAMGWRAAARVGQPGENDRAHWLGLLGAISFILSDSMIAIGKFHAPIPAGHFLVMATYWAGQLGIALSVARRAV